MREEKYIKNILSGLIKKSAISLNDRVLTIGATKAENDLFSSMGFINVTLTNISPIDTQGLRYPFILKNALKLDFPDNAFDVVFVCASLHHMSRPHLALTEMYRVAQKCVMFLESNDSILMRTLCALNLVDKYEENLDGIRKPNYVYRWNKREIKKTIRSFAPTDNCDFVFYTGFHMPTRRTKRILCAIFYPLLLLLRFFEQTNTLFTIILKKLPA